MNRGRQEHKEAIQERLFLSSTWNSPSTLFCSFQLINHYFLDENIFDRVTELSHQLSGLGTHGHQVLEMDQGNQDWNGRQGIEHLNSVPSCKPNVMVTFLVKVGEHSPSV